MKTLKHNKVVKKLTYKNHFLYKKLQKFKKDKKGVSAIEIVIGIFVFLIVLSFLVDLLTLSWKFAVISSTNSYVARTAGLQGGIESKAPDGFPGNNKAYISSSEMESRIATDFTNAGIQDGDYSVRVNGALVSKGQSTAEVDYRNSITTQIDVTYKWALMSNFIPGDLTQSLTSTRNVLSEFQFRYDNWTGE
jgi:Flp pilus assembly protein TadG